MQPECERRGGEPGFSLLEVLVALFLTMIVMASVFLLLLQGQNAFEREPELSALTGNARTGLTRITQELAVAGYGTPATLPVVWQDGGGDAPDVLTIVYGDSDSYLARPIPCGTSASARARPRGPGNWLARALGVFAPELELELLESATSGSEIAAGRRRRRGGERRRRDPDGPENRGGGGSAGAGRSGGGVAPPCGDVATQRGFVLDPFSIAPQPLDFETIYVEGAALMAIQGPLLDDPRCDAARPAIVPVTVVSEPSCTGTAGVGGSPADCGQLTLEYRARPLPELQLPMGFDRAVDLSCATVGMFHVVQYRVAPGAAGEAPVLERRDLLSDSAWQPLAGNIENLQLQYAQGVEGDFFDEPPVLPAGADPETFITRVRVSVAGRSTSANLAGATAGVRASDEAHLRRSFSTTVSLRNQLNQAQQKAERLGRSSWN